MNDSLLFPIILQLAGVMVIIAEIILPSGGILSIVALGVFGYSLFIVFKEISISVGLVFAAADLVLIPVPSWG
jgi:membrane-bound serine protease (ClpP class)